MPQRYLSNPKAILSLIIVFVLTLIAITTLSGLSSALHQKGRAPVGLANYKPLEFSGDGAISRGAVLQDQITFASLNARSASALMQVDEETAKKPFSLLRLLPKTLSNTHNISVQIEDRKFEESFAETRKFCRNQPNRKCRIAGLQQSAGAARLILLISQDSMDSLNSWLEQQGDIEFRNLNAAELGEDLRDVEMRLRQDQTLLNRLLELQSEAQDLQQLKDLASEVATVQGRVEQLQGQLVSLTSRILYDQVNIDFKRVFKATYAVRNDQASFWGRASQVFNKGLSDIWQTFEALGLALALMAPWVMLATPFILMVILFGVRLQRRQQEADAEALHAAAEAAVAASAKIRDKSSTEDEGPTHH